jgi:rSAM/selenodomain-associated transferase 1
MPPDSNSDWNERLIVFLKAPRPGHVKTRLAPALGEHGAAQAHRTLVETLLHRLAELPRLELRFAPDDAAPEIAPFRRNAWSLSPQGPGDLGARLVAAFDDAFAAGAERVAIIGSDCPEVSLCDIETAFAALRTDDLVLGPALDGGYWLIGLRRPTPELFSAMPWSTDRVSAETCTRAARLRLRLQILRELRDIDKPADWTAFLSRQTPLESPTLVHR